MCEVHGRMRSCGGICFGCCTETSFLLLAGKSDKVADRQTIERRVPEVAASVCKQS